jgi:hypothetical protein
MKQDEDEKFNAVDFMRKRREELSNLYNSDKDEFLNKLKEVQEKYAGRFHVTQKHIAQHGIAKSGGEE